MTALCRSRPRSVRRQALVLSLCLAIALLATPGTAWGISGFAGGGTAASAQYPDSGAANVVAQKAKISDLAQLTTAIRKSLSRDPVQFRAAQRTVVRREIEALSTVAGTDLGQKGSIALLVAAIAVAIVGGVVRWRRSDVRSE
jgi:hypothetical protein